MPIPPSVSAVVASVVVFVAAPAGAQQGFIEFLPGFWPRDLSADGSTLALTNLETWTGFLYRPGEELRSAPLNSPSLNTDGSRMMWTTGNTDLLIGTGWDDPGANPISVPVQGSCPASVHQRFLYAMHSDNFERISAMIDYVDSDGMPTVPCWWHGTPDGIVSDSLCGCSQPPAANCGRLAAYSGDGRGSIVIELRQSLFFSESAWIDIRWPSGGCTSSPYGTGPGLSYNAPVISGDGRTAMFAAWAAGQFSIKARCRDGGGCWSTFAVAGIYPEVIALSDDGRVVFGSRGGDFESFYWLWRPAAGAIDLATVMTRCGLDSTHLPIYGGFFYMSNDGTTFAGPGADAASVDGAWYLRIPPFPRSDLDWNFTVDSDDVITFFANYEAGDADYDDNGETNFQDVLSFFQDWDRSV